MKILTVLTYYHPHWTGLTAHAVRVAEGLAARGHEVTVLAARHDPDLPRDEIINGVRVVRLQPLFRYSRGMFTPAYPWAVGSLILKHEVIQVHSPLPEAPIVAGIAQLLGRPLLMTHHGDLVMPAGPFNRFLEWVGFRLLRLAGNLADAVTSYSRDYAQHSRLLIPLRHKLSYVYPPVELVAPDPVAAGLWKRELGLEDKVLLGFAGRWVEEKGYDFLLEAMPLVRERIPNAHLVYAGELNVVYEDFYQRCLPQIEAQREHITFLGLLREPRQMANFYHMLDIFVLPSRTDMMALVQIEAMLSGTPVVASDIPGARVVVQETGYGQLAPARDDKALADTLIDAYQRRGELKPSRNRVREVFNTGTTLDQYESILARVLQRRRERGGPSRQGLESSGRSRAVARGASMESLTPSDQEHLEGILRNEADMAYRRRVKILLDFLELKDGDRVLDAGCGMGFYLKAMSQLRRLDLVGLDYWLERLQWAKSESVAAGLVSGDLGRLPFADESFDSVLMSEVLEHLPNDEIGLSEIRRVLRPGGRLAISVPHANFPFLWDPIGRIYTGIGGSPLRSGPLVGIWTNHERLYFPDQLEEVVDASGFRVEKVEESTHFSFPFIHFLVYGIGKPLIEHRLLPEALASSADRFRAEDNSGSILNPINLGVSMFRRIDRLNESPRIEGKSTFVNVLLKASKPNS
jgi:glycosyltransferase involved in cell wall biosynthesis/SAM-dependent methyltransferase